LRKGERGAGDAILEGLAVGFGSGSASISGRDPSTKRRVCEATDMVANCRAAIIPWRTSRIRDRLVSGDRKISASSAVAATAERR
jgi:hypothetical protein